MTTVTQDGLQDANTGGLLVIAATVAALGLGLAGCETGPGRAAPVDATRAREALRVTLGRWKDGGRPSESAAGSPPVTVQDMDWEAGKALVDIEILGDGKGDDANLIIPARLTVREKGGRAVSKPVKYIVGTSPSVTVFRELF